MIKNFFSILSSVALLLTLCVSCQKEPTGVFVADMEGGNNGSKSYISGLHNCWESTDHVYVNGEEATDLHFEGGKAVYTAPTRSSNYNMFTCGGIPITSWTGNAVVFNIPSDFSEQDMPMYATTNQYGPVTFHNIFSVLHVVHVPQDTVISVLSTNTQVGGSFAYNFVDGSISNGTVGTMLRSVKSPSGNVGDSNDLWIVLPPLAAGTFSIGIGSKIYTSSNWVIHQNKIVTLNYRDFDNPVTPPSDVDDDDRFVVITTADQLLAALKTGGDAKYIMLADTIDLRGKAQGTLNKDLNLRGNGYTLIIDKPFVELKGNGYTISVTDLHLTGTFNNSSYTGAFTSSSLGNSVTVNAPNCTSTVTYNGNHVPFLP